MPSPTREAKEVQQSAAPARGAEPAVAAGLSAAPDARFHKFKLGAIWERLGAVARDLWNGNSPAAVELQALYEEFRGEAERAEMAIESYRRTLAEQRSSLRAEFEEAYSHRLKDLESKAAALGERLSRSEENLVLERRRAEALRRDILEKESEMGALREQSLKTQEEHDAQKAQRLGDLFGSLKKRREELEALFSERSRALESSYASELQSLQSRHSEALENFRVRLSEMEAHYANRERELDKSRERMMAELSAWEAKNRQRDETLLQREGELIKQERELVESYRKKQFELEKTKDEMQRELSEMVRRYRGGERSAGPEKPSV